jgi:hypothetical protein
MSGGRGSEARCTGPQHTPGPTGKLGNWHSGPLVSFPVFQNPNPPTCRMALMGGEVGTVAASLPILGYGRTRDPDLHSVAGLVGIWFRITFLS